ncbi:hypothetical protein ACQP2U_43620 (plasmid) [Nocardia sp. CA-084685]|uniref:hypothetical protein n=1 Tax=Nocardia sp. CA-084685 TaxID=3239970 RepID=UPI003D97AA9E
MRTAMQGVIDFVPSDDELRRIWSDQQLIALAHAWGWSDTEVREQLAAALEKNHTANS